MDTAGGACPCIHDQEIVFSPLPCSVDPGNTCSPWLCEFVTAAPLRGHPFPFWCQALLSTPSSCSKQPETQPYGAKHN